MKPEARQSKRRIAETIVSRLRKQKHEAYFVGGCVRDMVLGKRPSDFDIATSARPQDVASIFEKTIPVGEAFGVMIVRLEGENFEVATFRVESDYRDGRRPSHVAFADAKADCLRRDFTVNGLFFDPVAGQILDWVGGVRDAKRKMIQTIGVPQKRFEEDKLRMLRAVRFAANLGFRIEARTLEAVRKMRRQIRVVSAERIRDELVKLLTGPHPATGLDWLDRSGLLEVVLPEVYRMKRVCQPRRYHPEGDVYKHTRLMMGHLKNPGIVLAFASLLHDVGKPVCFQKAKRRIHFYGHDRAGARITENIMNRLRFSNDIKKQVTACVEYHMQFKDAMRMRTSTLKRMFQRPTFETELEQHRVDCLASHGDLSVWRFLRKKIKHLSQTDIHPLPLVRGKDLLDLGMSPGPRVGQILKKAEEKQLEGELKTRAEALDWVKALLK